MHKSNTCLFPWIHMYYHNNKKVYPCCKLAGVEKFEIGNTSDSIETLWNSSILKQLRVDNINNTQPKECYINCFNSINPLHTYIPDTYLSQQQDFFATTSPDGSFKNNFVVWNINESNVCNFQCTYCCIEFSNQFNDHSLRKSFNTIDDMINVFEANINHIEILFLSAGESHLQPGYYRMLETLIKHKKNNIEINVHTNLSGYMYGKKNLFELLNQFNNVTVFASLDSYGSRAEYIRKGTVWSDIEATRIKLFSYPNIKFAVQSVITNLNLWSLPDFHAEWYNKGFINKNNIRYFCLSTPEFLNIRVMKDNFKQKILDKFKTYFEFLKYETCTRYNTVTPLQRVQQILEDMLLPSSTPISIFNYQMLKNHLQNNIKFKDIFIEFAD